MLNKFNFAKIFVAILTLISLAFFVYLYINISKDNPPNIIPKKAENKAENKSAFIEFALLADSSFKRPAKTTVLPSQMDDFSASTFDVALAVDYANYRNKTAVVKRFENKEELLNYFADNPEIIIVGLTDNYYENLKHPDILLTEPYNEEKQVVIGVDKYNLPLSLLNFEQTQENKNDIESYTIIINQNNPAVAELLEIAKNIPQINVETSNLSIFDLADKVINNKNYFAVINNNNIPYLQLQNQAIKVKLTLNVLSRKVWGISKNSKEQSTDSINLFFESIRENNRLLSLAEKYTFDIDRIDFLDLEYFYRRVKLRLMPLIPYFKNAGKITEQPWTLLAALSYQESQWDHLAVSSTGARGLMMINEITAEQLKVPYLAEPHQQIIAGAKYLKIMRQDINYIPEEDRTLIALAAYNLGPGAMSGVLRRIINIQIKNNSLAEIKKSKNENDKLVSHGIYIKTSLPENPANYLNNSLNWPEVRNYVLEQSKRGRISSQPIILAERIRFFQKLLVGMERLGYFDEKKNKIQ